MSARPPSSANDLLLAGIVEAAPVGVLLIAQDGLISFANTALENMFGYSRSQLIGQAVEMLLPEHVRQSHIDYRKLFFRTPSARTMGSGRELYARHANGENFPIEIGLGSMGSGADAQAIAFVIDISARRREERRFSTIVDSLPVGLVIVNGLGNIVMANPCLSDMFGYIPAELTGQPIEILLPERLRAAHPHLRAAFMQAPSVRGMGKGRDLLAQHKTGKEFPVEVALTPIEQNGQLVVLAAITDISQRKTLEDSLKLANANLEEFTYVASHDLRSPLRGIADLLHWIKEELSEAQMSPTITQNFARAELRVARAERMIDDLLTYARAGERHESSEDCDLSGLIDNAIDLAPISNVIQIENQVPPLTIHTARVPLFTAIRNLIDNAVKHHGGEQGLIRISFHEAGHFYVISVEDDGQGIAENMREKIFKLFHRASTKAEGNGIGLAVTRRLVQAHGGDVVLDQEGSLPGACFRIFWPRYQLKES